MSTYTYNVDVVLLDILEIKIHGNVLTRYVNPTFVTRTTNKLVVKDSAEVRRKVDSYTGGKRKLSPKDWTKLGNIHIASVNYY